jgi:membrane protease subunit HflC
MKRNLFILIVGALLFVVFCLLLFCFQVRQSEVAVVTTFGRPTTPISEPGLHFKLPWPIQKVYKFDQRTQNFEDRLTEGLTRDGFNLLTCVYVGWRITDAAAFLPKFAGAANPISEAERQLEQALGNLKSAAVGKHALSDFVSATDNGTNLLGIEKEILTAIQSRVNTNNWGLEVVFLGLKKLQLPESVSKTVFDRMDKERKVLSEALQAAGDAEAARIRSDADRRASELLADADGQATQIRAQGEARAAEYLKVFQQNPALANFLFKLNALESSLNGKSTLIFDQNTSPFDLLYGAPTNLLHGAPANPPK